MQTLRCLLCHPPIRGRRPALDLSFPPPSPDLSRCTNIVKCRKRCYKPTNPIELPVWHWSSRSAIYCHALSTCLREPNPRRPSAEHSRYLSLAFAAIPILLHASSRLEGKRKRAAADPSTNPVVLPSLLAPKNCGHRDWTYFRLTIPPALCRSPQLF